MGFLANIHGGFGDEKVTSTAKIGSLPLGARMMLPDGRIFAHAKAGATALDPGKLYQAKAGEANTIFISTLALANADVGAKEIVITVSGTALSDNVYSDGYITLHTGTGIGHTYKVKSHGIADASTCTVSLESTDFLVTAIAGGTTTAGMRKNEFDEVLLTTANTVSTNSLAGIPACEVAASSYCWVQRRGPVLCLEDNSTCIVGFPVTASTVTAGAVGLYSWRRNMQEEASTAGFTINVKELVKVGECMSVGGSGGYALINLMLE